jgi:hypothetical protein
MGEPTLEALTQRLERLERQNLRIKQAGAVLFVALAALLVMGQASPGGQVVEAQRFVVRDPSTGRGRAALSLLQDGSVGLSILALDGRSLSLSADAGGNMGLTLYDRNRKLRAELFSGPDGSPALAVRDAGGKILWKAP